MLHLRKASYELHDCSVVTVFIGCILYYIQVVMQ